MLLHQRDQLLPVSLLPPDFAFPIGTETALPVGFDRASLTLSLHLTPKSLLRICSRSGSLLGGETFHSPLKFWSRIVFNTK